MVNGNRVIRRRQRREVSGPDPVVHGRLDQPGDRANLNLAGDKGCDRDLIGRIVYRGQAASGP